MASLAVTMDVVLELVACEESADLDESTTQFCQGRLTTVARLVEFV